MKLLDIIYKQQKLITLQVLIFSLVFSVILVVSVLVYKKTTIYDEAKEAVRIKKIDKNKVFEQMHSDAKEPALDKN